MVQKTVPYPPGLDSIVRKLRTRGLIPLRPRGIWDQELNDEIGGLDPGAAGLPENDFFLCLRAGLHLWNDDLDGAHRIARGIPSTTAAYWHGILHRREGDYGNSKYWFRVVGAHLLFRTLHKEARDLAREYSADPFADRVAASARWDPFAYVDACREGEETEFLRSLQVREIDLLVRFCHRKGKP